MSTNSKPCDIRDVISEFKKIVLKKHQDVIKMEGIVVAIDRNTSSFTVRSVSHNKYQIVCVTEANDDSIDKLDITDHVVMHGVIQVVYPTICLLVKHIYKNSFRKFHEDRIKLHKQMSNNLKNDKLSAKIETIHNRPLPRVAYNIGVIVLPNDEANIANFKAVYREVCVGKIYFFRLSQVDDNASIDLESAMEYFRKYNDIDMVVLLFNSAPAEKIYAMTTIDNIKYALKTENYPYTVAITNPQSNIEPVIYQVVNRRVAGIYNFTSMVYKLQSTDRIIIGEAIDNLRNTITLSIQNKKMRLGEMKYRLSRLPVAKEINDTRDHEQPLQVLKKLLVEKLESTRTQVLRDRLELQQHILELEFVKQLLRRAAAIKDKQHPNLDHPDQQDQPDDVFN